MEYLEGETLAHRLKKGPLAPEQVLQYGIQIICLRWPFDCSGQMYDSEIPVWRISALFKKEGREVRAAQEPRDIQNAERSEGARASSAIFQAGGLG